MANQSAELRCFFRSNFTWSAEAHSTVSAVVVNRFLSEKLKAINRLFGFSLESDVPNNEVYSTRQATLGNRRQ